VILAETDPRLVFFELDIFWAYAGESRFPGFKPHEYPWSMPERFPLFHVKDGIDYNGDEVEGNGQFFGWDMTDVGGGDIAFEPFFCGLDTKPRHYLVERDTAPDPVRNPAGSSPRPERSYAYLAGLRERRGGRSRSLGAPPSVTRVIRLPSIFIARDETQALDLPETAANHRRHARGAARRRARRGDETVESMERSSSPTPAKSRSGRPADVRREALTTLPFAE
jgi:hypothetical protein